MGASAKRWLTIPLILSWYLLQAPNAPIVSLQRDYARCQSPKLSLRMVQSQDRRQIGPLNVSGLVQSVYDRALTVS